MSLGSPVRNTLGQLISRGRRCSTSYAAPRKKAGTTSRERHGQFPEVPSFALYGEPALNACCRPILLKNSVSTEDESNLALIGREGRVKLRGYKDEPISQPRASPLRHKRNVDGNFDRIRSWRKFSALAISSFSTE